MTICAFSILPNDILKVVCSNLTARELSRFGQTSKGLNILCASFAEYFAKDEQECLGIPFQGVPLTMRRLIEHWGTLPTETCKKISDALKSRPIMFYTLNFVRTAAIMMTPTVIRAREKHKDKFVDAIARQMTETLRRDSPSKVEKQFILACYTGDSLFVEQFLDSLQIFHQSTKKFSLEAALEILCYKTTSNQCKRSVIEKSRQVTWEQAIEIANSISDPDNKAGALSIVACRKDIPVDVAERIADSFDEDKKTSVLCELLRRDGVPLKKAFEIAKKITQEPMKSRVLYDLALRVLDEGLWKEALALANSILDPKIQSEALGIICISGKLPPDVAEQVADSIPDNEYKSNALGILALEENVPWKKKLKIANRIPLEPWKSTTFFELALRALKEFLWKEAFEIALTIPDVNKRSEALAHFFRNAKGIEKRTLRGRP